MKVPPSLQGAHPSYWSKTEEFLATVRGVTAVLLKEMSEWVLEVRFPDASERAPFASRREALEHAEAIERDYDGVVTITLVDPFGIREMIGRSMFMHRDGTDSGKD